MANPSLEGFFGPAGSRPPQSVIDNGYVANIIPEGEEHTYLFHQLYAASNKSANDGIWDWEDPGASDREYNTYSVVRHSGKIWESKVDSNTSEPGANTDWGAPSLDGYSETTLGDGATLSTTELTITQKFTTLPSSVWDGSGNVDIEDIVVPTSWPDGTEFEIVVPRTAAETGGTAGTLGNYVRFVHGTGNISCDANRKQGGAFSYRAYPDANDNYAASVSSVALYEKLRFVKDGSTIRLIKLPDSLHASNAYGEIIKRADGSIELRKYDAVLTYLSSNTLSYTWTLPCAVSDIEYYLGGSLITSSGFAKYLSTYLYQNSAATSSVNARIDSNGAFLAGNTCNQTLILNGRWKQQD